MGSAIGRLRQVAYLLAMGVLAPGSAWKHLGWLDLPSHPLTPFFQRSVTESFGTYLLYRVLPVAVPGPSRGVPASISPTSDHSEMKWRIYMETGCRKFPYCILQVCSMIGQGVVMHIRK